MHILLRGVITIIALVLSGGVSTAQFVAFNDHAPGPGTAPNTTRWSADLASGSGSTGPLKDINTGTALPVSVTVTVSGNVTFEGVQGNPAAGTPLYNAFNGFVDFAGTNNPSIALNGPGATVTYTFSGLDPAKHYIFKGSAVRAGGVTYTNRWSLFELAGADSFTTAHTANVLTTAQVPAILPNQCAINTGINDIAGTGDMADWENIEPGADGSFAVKCYQYTNAVPGGGSSSSTKGFGITGMRLEEVLVPPSAVVITNQPKNVTVGELQPAAFVVGVQGSPKPTFQWYKDEGVIDGATNSTYLIAAAPLSDNNAVFKVVTSNVTNGVINTVTSSNAVLHVIADSTKPVLVRAVSLSELSVQVLFSEVISELTATNIANYSITSGSGNPTIISAVLQANGSNVVLNTSQEANATTYTLTVNGIKDISAAGNQINPGSTAQFTTAAGFTGADVGGPGVPGTVTSAAGGYDLQGSGTDIGGTSDQFTFGYQQRTGDFDYKVRVQGLTLADAWSKAGLMARQTLSANSAYAAALATPSVSGCLFQARVAVGGVTTSQGSAPVNYPSTWLRLKRAGSLFTGYASFDGVNWAPLGSASVTMSDPIFFGFVASSHTNTILTTAQFREQGFVTGGSIVTALTPANEPLGPSTRRTGIAITEIMYHPTVEADVPGDPDGEFIEIYNSQAFFEKIGGYRLSGEIDYTFPAATVIPSGAFIVVAKDPDYIQSKYGITALGPWTGTLSNNKGTVRLRNRQNAVMLDVPYDTRQPWPVAPDGTGHSLVLAKASYGEGDPRAWAASDQIGGSPGHAEPVTESTEKAVVINEVLAHTDNVGAQDFIELYNHGNQGINLSGAYLSDDPATNKYRIPNGTIIASNSFLSFDQATLGFGLAGDGGRVFLVNSNLTRVIDAINYGEQANGISVGRLPDGSKTFRELASPTPGAANRTVGLKVRDIVINELMYSPISGNNDDEYIELYNKGSSSINLAGWQFVDGITFTFPSNSIIAASGYFVVAKNATNLFAHYGNLNAANTVGDYSGTLANGGEHIALAKPEPDITTNALGQFETNTIFVVVNDLTYGKGGRWGVWADGGGSSLELVDPRSDNQQPANWADSDETAKSQWTSFEATVGIGETLGSPINDNVHLYLLGIGECLLDEVEVRNGGGANLVPNPGFESGLANWFLQGSHDLSSLESVGFAGANSLHIRAGSRGDPGANRIRSGVIAASGTVTLRAKARWLKGWPELLMRLHGGGAEVTGKLQLPTNLGTPGLPNSRLVSNAGPAIFDVSHSPVLPPANAPVLITAKVSDPDGISRLSVRYRIDPAPNYTTINMVDNGSGGDAISGDGIYTATIPGQAASAIVAFYLEAVDSLQATNVFPQDVFPKAGLARTFPNDSPTRECVLRWGEVQMPGGFATYHLWLTAVASNRWAVRDPLNNAQMDGTFSYNNYRSVYNSLPLYAGSPWHRGQMTSGPGGSSRVDYVMNFPNDDRMLGTTDFVLNNPGNPGGSTTSDISAQTEQTSYIMFNEINIVYNHRRYIHYFLNGSQRSTTADRTGNFIFEDSQQPNGDMINEWFPDDTDGELYKIEDWFEFNDNGYDFSSNNDADLTRRLLPGSTQLSIAPYRYMFRKRSLGAGDSASDYHTFFSMVDAASPPSDPSGPINFAALDGVVDWEQWMRIFAVQHAVGNWDSYGYRRGKNDYTYKPVNGRFEQMTWDIDFTMGVGGDSATQPLSGDETDPRVTAMRNEPAIGRAYWRAFYDIVNGPMNRSFLDPILDAKAAALLANNINVDLGTVSTIKNYTQARHDFILTQLASVASPFTVNGNSTFVTTNNLVVLTGTAPVNVKTIRINGIEYPVKWTSVTTWSTYIAINPGLNVLNVQGYDLKGNPITGQVATVNVTYTGPQLLAKDFLVINEVMYHPVVNNASYVEIYNNSAIGSFDLSNWRLSGVDYTFPPGTIVSNKQLLLIVKDYQTFAATYGVSIPVLGEFDGNLDPDGEKLALIKPGATPEQDVVIDALRYEAGEPWPVAASVSGASLQLVDASQDNSRVSNWSDGSGWRFFSFTSAPGGISTSTQTFTLTLDTASDFYIDELSLVTGSVAGVGPNLFQNGGFETGVLTPWSAIGNHAASAVSTDTVYAGNGSLHVIGSGPGSVPNNEIAQTVTNIFSTNNYTLSFWFLPSTNATGFNFRLTSTFRSLTSVNLRPSNSSPGAPNPIATSVEPYPLLWINEIQPNNLTGITDNNSQHDPWVEIYNSGTNPISLNGFALANTYGNLTQWPFPNDAVINPGEFKVVFADGEPGQTTGNQLHTSFRLDAANGSIVLSKAGRILDYINYTNIAADFSYGSFLDGQVVDRQRFFYTTPGLANNGAPVPVIINEWLASNTNNIVDPATGKHEDWLELYNFGSIPVDLSGYFLTDNLGQKKEWAFPAGTVISAGGFLKIWADNAATNSTPGDLHADFQLSKNGEEIGLFTPDGLTVDSVRFGAQLNDVSQGRFPDGNFAGVLYFMTTPTPDSANALPANLSAPSLPGIVNRTINEGSLLSITNLATDADSPPQTLTYSLDAGAPAGAGIDPKTGIFTWRPTEAQGGAPYGFTVRVSDNGSPTHTDAKTFSVTVNKVNSPPNFLPLPQQTVAEDGTLTLGISASDSDIPTQSVSFALGAGAPAGASIDAVTGLFTWTPSEAQGPSTNNIVVRVSDDGIPSASTTQILAVVVTEVNLAPTLLKPGPFTIDEGKLFTNMLVATDADLPTNRLTFATLAPFISGVTVNGATGLLSWTPSEVQGGSNIVVSVRVFDNGTPSLSSTQTINFTISKVNAAPVLINLNNSTRTINELTSITLTNKATDNDIPTNSLTYELVSPLTGATLNPTNGIFAWTPSEAQGPSSNSILVRVFDDGTPSLSATQRFTIIVNEVNLAPVLSPIANQTVNVGVQLRFTNVVNDPDLPAQTMTFTLGPGAPTGVNVDSNGIFTWTPTAGQAPSTNQMSIRVADNGTPSLSATQSFTVFVTTSIQITGIQPVDATHVSITWASQAGKTYQLEYRDNLDPATIWQTLANTQVTAVGPSQSMSVSTSLSTQRFYRIVQTN